MHMNTWLSTTTDMLRSTSIPLAEIAVSAKVELRWLYKFKDGYFQDPGVTKVQRIYDFLRKKQGANLETPHGTEATETTCCPAHVESDRTGSPASIPDGALTETEYQQAANSSDTGVCSSASISVANEQQPTIGR